MPDLDLEPHEYAVKGRKEPILQRGWWVGILVFVLIVLVGAFIIRPMHGGLTDFLSSLIGR